VFSVSGNLSAGSPVTTMFLSETTSRSASRAPPPRGFALQDSGRWTMRWH
jgi:hypothetical protein